MNLFFQKCASNVQVDSRELDRRKTLQVSLPVKTTNDNDEFEKQRTAAIAEVAKSKEVRQLSQISPIVHGHSCFSHNESPSSLTLLSFHIVEVEECHLPLGI